MRGIMLAMLAAACGGSSMGPGMRLTNPQFGADHARRSQRFALSFELAPGGTSGTAVVLEYLRSAEARGPRYISDLAIVLQLRHDGAPVECVSKLMVEDGAPRAAWESSERGRPAQIRAHVADRELVCKGQERLVTGKAAKHDNRYDAAAPAPVMQQGHRVEDVAEVAWDDECKLITVERDVERYAHFVEARFTPPDLVRIQRQYSDWQLREAPPLCRPLELAPGAPLVQHVEAQLHFTTNDS